MLGEQGARINNTVDLHAHLHGFIVASITVCGRGRERTTISKGALNLEIGSNGYG